MNLPLKIGLRYTRAKRKNHFISFISFISIAGIALGVMTVIVVISVMNGFDRELKERMLSMVSHATISTYGNEYLTDWKQAIDKAIKHPQVLGAAPYIDSEVLIQGSRTEGALVRGIVPELEEKVTQINDKMRFGSLDDLQPGAYRIVLGSELAATLGVGPGDKVMVYAPQFKTTAVGIVPRVKRFTVSGIFEVGMYEFDSKLAIVHLRDAQKLFRTGDGVEGIRLELKDLMQAPRVARELARELGGFYRVRDWTQQNVNFFKATQTERMVMFIILSMIVAVAAFNILSTLVMLVTEKQSDIAILRTQGLSRRQVMGIFMVTGVVIGLIGTALGTAAGLVIAYNIDVIIPALERFFHTDFMSADVYYVSEITADVKWHDVLTIVLVSFGLTLLATIYPAWRASRVQPAEALRYE